jgi:hypothetical protein
VEAYLVKLQTFVITPLRIEIQSALHPMSLPSSINQETMQVAGKNNARRR